jgi:hypothetical protein
MWEGPDGPIEVGDRDEAGAICGVDGETYANYARTGRPKKDPAPKAVTRDLATGRLLYPLDEVRQWQIRRPGRGNWGGEGARARKPEET